MLADVVDLKALRSGVIRLPLLCVDMGECGLCGAFGRRYNTTCWECLSPSLPATEKGMP